MVLLGSEAQAVVMVIDDEDLFRPQHAGASGRHLADRTGAVNGHGGTLTHPGILHRLVAGGQDIAQEQHLLIGQGRIDADGPDVGLGHAHILRLSARYAPIEMAVAEHGGTRADAFAVHDRAAIRVGGLAGGVEMLVAEEALAAGDDERHHHAVALLEAFHARSRFHHDAHEFMAEDVPCLGGGNLATIEVQVGAADGGGRDFEDDVVGFLDDRVGDSLDPHVMG